MEKLEKLLKEYAPNYCNDLPNGIIMDELVISKKFGFIGWLVENDKIDKKKIRSPIMHYKVEEDREGGIHYYDLDFADKTNSLLMLLSISDTPIEDLISYLR